MLSSSTNLVKGSSKSVSATSWFEELVLAINNCCFWHRIYRRKSLLLLWAYISYYPLFYWLKNMLCLVVERPNEHLQDVQFVDGHGRCQPKHKMLWHKVKRFYPLLENIFFVIQFFFLISASVRKLPNIFERLCFF